MDDILIPLDKSSKLYVSTAIIAPREKVSAYYALREYHKGKVWLIEEGYSYTYVVYGVNRGIFAVVMSLHSNVCPWKLLCMIFELPPRICSRNCDL